MHTVSARYSNAMTLYNPTFNTRVQWKLQPFPKSTATSVFAFMTSSKSIKRTQNCDHWKRIPEFFFNGHNFGSFWLISMRFHRPVWSISVKITFSFSKDTMQNKWPLLLTSIMFKATVELWFQFQRIPKELQKFAAKKKFFV